MCVCVCETHHRQFVRLMSTNLDLSYEELGTLLLFLLLQSSLAEINITASVKLHIVVLHFCALFP